MGPFPPPPSQIAFRMTVDAQIKAYSVAHSYVLSRSHNHKLAYQVIVLGVICILILSMTKLSLPAMPDDDLLLRRVHSLQDLEVLGKKEDFSQSKRSRRLESARNHAKILENMKDDIERNLRKDKSELDDEIY